VDPAPESPVCVGDSALLHGADAVGGASIFDSVRVLDRFLPSRGLAPSWVSPFDGLRPGALGGLAGDAPQLDTLGESLTVHLLAMAARLLSPLEANEGSTLNVAALGDARLCLSDASSVVMARGVGCSYCPLELMMSGDKSSATATFRTSRAGVEFLA